MRKWLKEIRENANMSQKEVAERVEITQQYYNYIENGDRRPSPEKAKAIGAVLKFPWTKFYEEETKTA